MKKNFFLVGVCMLFGLGSCGDNDENEEDLSNQEMASNVKVSFVESVDNYEYENLNVSFVYDSISKSCLVKHFINQQSLSCMCKTKTDISAYGDTVKITETIIYDIPNDLMMDCTYNKINSYLCNNAEAKNYHFIFTVKSELGEIDDEKVNLLGYNLMYKDFEQIKEYDLNFAVGADSIK